MSDWYVEAQKNRLAELRDKVRKLTAENGDLRDQLATLQGIEPGHVIEIREDGWAIQHPLSCRPNLFDCTANQFAMDSENLPLGRYRVMANGDWLIIGDEL